MQVEPDPSDEEGDGDCEFLSEPRVSSLLLHDYSIEELSSTYDDGSGPHPNLPPPHVDAVLA
jgi:hypothetical protein